MSVIGEILAEAKRKGHINFGPGLPDPRTFPAEEIRKILTEVKEEYLNYTPYDGLDELREEVTRFLERRGIENREVIVTSGAQEAIGLLALYLRGKGVRVGNPGYLEAVTAFKVHGAYVAPADIDERGEVPDVSDAYYIIPTGHNPTGRTMDLERREEFAQLSKEVLVIEDGTYDMLYYGDEPRPVASLTDKSVYIFSFSKVVSPGLRLGVLALPEDIKETIMRLRPALNICPPAISQFVLTELLRKGMVERNAERAREIYRKKRDTLIGELKGVLDFVEPSAGFFLWTKLPVDGDELLERARREGVVFIPGKYFYITRPDSRTARLSFSYETPERIEKGAKILRELLEKA